MQFVLGSQHRHDPENVVKSRDISWPFHTFRSFNSTIWAYDSLERH